MTRWLTLCPGADTVGESLLARWGESHRSYHDLRHLSFVLVTVDLLAGSGTARHAAWWHDAVYDPRATDNERRSAELAEQTLRGLGLDADRVSDVVRLVLLTETHDPAESDVDGQALCDSDLRVLAGAPAAYDTYVADVRSEYAHVNDTDWCTGRSAVLQQLLDLPQLFHTTTGRTWEDPARANLTRELASLTGGA